MPTGVSTQFQPAAAATEVRPKVLQVLEATGASLATFVGYIAKQAGATAAATLPMLGLGRAADGASFDAAGRPAGSDWDEIPFPAIDDSGAFALEVEGEGMEPVFRDGDILVVSPSAGLRRGDRVVVKTVAGQLMVRQLVRRTARRLDFAAINAANPACSLTVEETAWLARILWASQ